MIFKNIITRKCDLLFVKILSGFSEPEVWFIWIANLMILVGLASLDLTIALNVILCFY